MSVAIYSLLKSANPAKEMDIYLVHDTGFADLGGCSQIQTIVDRFPFAHIRFINFDPMYAQYASVLDSPRNSWTHMVWAWTFCTDLLPEISGNLVFIDWDMFVLKDLEELYSLDLENDGFISAAISESKREHRPELVAAGWPEKNGCSITTALQVINTDAFRREHVREKMFNWFINHKDAAICVEQDAINVICGDRIKRLHPRYNCPVSWLSRVTKDNFLRREWRVFASKDVLEAITNPSIIHFIGGHKPWRYNHRPWRNVYKRALIDLGLTDGTLPGESCAKKVIGRCFDLYNCLLFAYARTLLFIANNMFRSKAMAIPEDHANQPT